MYDREKWQLRFDSAGRFSSRSERTRKNERSIIRVDVRTDFRIGRARQERPCRADDRIPFIFRRGETKVKKSFRYGYYIALPISRFMNG